MNPPTAARVLAHSPSCTGGNCPTVLASGGDVLVQGYALDPAAAELPAGYTVPAGEALVRIPQATFDQLLADYLANGQRAVTPV
jgi:hypothetical protein